MGFMYPVYLYLFIFMFFIYQYQKVMILLIIVINQFYLIIIVDSLFNLE